MNRFDHLLMIFRCGVVFAMGIVRNTVLGSHPSSRDCMKQNKSKYQDKLEISDHTIAMSCFVAGAQPLIYTIEQLLFIFTNTCTMLE